MKIDENAQIVVYYEGLDKKDKEASEIKKLYLDLLENGTVIYDKKDDEKRAMIMLDNKTKAYLISVVSLNKRTMNEILIHEIPVNRIPSQILQIEKVFQDIKKEMLKWKH